jgi:signal transduction histidine kinase
MEPLAAERGVKLSANLADCTAAVDPAAIQQAVVNLVDNAIKFSPAGGTVTVTLTDTEAGWVLAVSDEGPGIPAAEHERIFERFHRLGNELRRETQGTGIGLSIVKHIAEAHGGTVKVADREGGGTVFTITTRGEFQVSSVQFQAESKHG